MESEHAATLPGPRAAASGPIGVALCPATNPLNGELVEAVMAAAAELGLEARVVRPGDDQSRLGLLLGVGYQGYLLPVFATPRVCPRVIWMGEPLPLRDDAPRGMLSRLARSPAMDILRYPLRPFKDAPMPRALARVRASATLEREAARNLRQLQRLVRAVDRVVVTSRDRRAALLAHGLDAEAIPFGYSAATAGPLTPPDRGPRDLEVVSLGRLHSRMARRRSVIDGWRAEEANVTVLEGVWAEERGALLRRSGVVLNVARTPGEFAGVRFILAIAAGAAVVSDPVNDPFPFVAGEHFVEAPLEGLLDAALELMADEPRRHRMVRAGQALLADELSMARCLSRVLGLE